jgi:type IV pilus assembly protein PilE
MKNGFTIKEALTTVIVLVVIAAVALPMWRTHQLRNRRQDAIDALRAVQAAQDDYFGKHARYAEEAQLRASAPKALTGKGLSAGGYYQLTLRKSADDLTYLATAHVVPLESGMVDTRCVELRIDQNGRRFAVDAEGVDRSTDCWR